MQYKYEMWIYNNEKYVFFQNGQLVSNSIDERNLRDIRGDKITWVKGTEPDCINIGFLINQVSKTHTYPFNHNLTYLFINI